MGLIFQQEDKTNMLAAAIKKTRGLLSSNVPGHDMSQNTTSDTVAMEIFSWKWRYHGMHGGMIPAKPLQLGYHSTTHVTTR